MELYFSILTRAQFVGRKMKLPASDVITINESVYCFNELSRKMGSRPAGKWLVINVTSAQPKNSRARIELSPMSLREYKGYCCFENYWQSLKVYENADNKVVNEWWKQQTKGHRRCPLTKGKKVLHARGLGYIESRKKIYVPEYFSIMKKSTLLAELPAKMAAYDGVIIYDFDGPRDVGEPLCCLLTLDLLKEKINDVIYPFGHGYIIAGYLAGFVPEDYC